MTNLTIKNVPTALYERLKARAEANRRSLNSEVIYSLERSVGVVPVDVADLLARVRSVRERVRLPYATPDELRAARSEGRA